jgi:DNA-binding MarR family transcriptional regulator
MPSKEGSFKVHGDHLKKIMYLIRKLIQAGELYSKELDRNFQVSVPQLLCLLNLHENGSLTPSQIAKNTMVGTSTMTGIIDRLEKKGLVTRVRNSPDRRTITISLTEAGKKLARRAPPPIRQEIIDGLERLPKDEIERIIHGLEMFVKLIDTQELEVKKSN